jgi:RimJ/RimL family protein N-acetyltransferase
VGLGEQVLLREVADEDLPIFFEHQLDPDATAMAAFPSRDREAFMAHWARILCDDSVVVRTIVFGEHVAGNVVSWQAEAERLVGYWIGREYWGKGIATKALSAFLEIVEPRPLHARVATHNVGSIRVLEKCGFARSGESNEELVLRLDASSTSRTRSGGERVS